jgi:ribosomal protein S18 acetylase RimI-like enzyme
VIDVRIRAATTADVEALLVFWAQSAEGTSVSDDPAGVANLITRDPEALLIAETSGLGTSGGPGAADQSTIVGTLIAGFDGWRCHLYRFAVSPAYRRQGIGSALLSAAEERFAALGGRRGDVMVLDHNTLAHSAWSAAGYRRQDDWSRWIKPFG